MYFDDKKLGAAVYDKDADEIRCAFADRIPGYFHGTGDVFGSALLAGLLHGYSLDAAAQLAVDYTHRCILLTVEANQENVTGLLRACAAVSYPQVRSAGLKARSKARKPRS